MVATRVSIERASLPGSEAQTPSRDGLQLRAFPARAISEYVTRCDGTLLSLARQWQILDTLRQAASQLVVERPLPELFEELLEMLLAAVPAQRAALLVQEGTPPRLVLRAARSRSGAPVAAVSRSIARRVLEDGVAVLLADALHHPVFSSAESLVRSGVRSALCAPLWLARAEGGADEVVGLVYLDSPGVPNAFDAEDVGLVTAIANIAAVKLRTARLLEASRENARLQEEMRLAAEVQASLLPLAPPELPGWSVAGFCRPSRAMGGDYFDWEHAAGGLCLAVADVSGKGAAAAMLLAAVRALVREHWGDANLAAAAERISRAVFDSVPSERYATGFLGRLHPATGELTYVNAGHLPPLVVRAGGQVEALPGGGFPFGLLRHSPYTAGVTQLDAGDTLLVFSDGLTEAEGPGGAEIGSEPIVTIARQGRTLDARGLSQSIGRQVEALTNGRPSADDRTLLVVKRCS